MAPLRLLFVACLFVLTSSIASVSLNRHDPLRALQKLNPAAYALVSALLGCPPATGKEGEKVDEKRTGSSEKGKSFVQDLSPCGGGERSRKAESFIQTLSRKGDPLEALQQADPAAYALVKSLLLKTSMGLPLHPRIRGSSAPSFAEMSSRRTAAKPDMAETVALLAPIFDHLADLDSEQFGGLQQALDRASA